MWVGSGFWSAIGSVFRCDPRVFTRAPDIGFGFEKEKKKARAAKPTLVVVAVGIFFRGREWSSPPG